PYAKGLADQIPDAETVKLTVISERYVGRVGGDGVVTERLPSAAAHHVPRIRYALLDLERRRGQGVVRKALLEGERQVAIDLRRNLRRRGQSVFGVDRRHDALEVLDV